jgi:hypothetical protein
MNASASGPFPLSSDTTTDGHHGHRFNADATPHSHPSGGDPTLHPRHQPPLRLLLHRLPRREHLVPSGTVLKPRPRPSLLRLHPLPLALPSRPIQDAVSAARTQDVAAVRRRGRDGPRDTLVFDRLDVHPGHG